MSAANVELARRGYLALMSGDVSAIRELLDPDVKWHGGDPSAEGACRNRREAIAFIEQRGPRGALVELIDAGDKVVAVVEQPDGARVANVATFRDGKVTEMVNYDDVDAAIAAAKGV